MNVKHRIIRWLAVLPIGMTVGCAVAQQQPTGCFPNDKLPNDQNGLMTTRKCTMWIRREVRYGRWILKQRYPSKSQTKIQDRRDTGITECTYSQTETYSLPAVRPGMNFTYKY